MYENGNLSAADVYAVTRNNDSNNGMWGGDWFGYLLLFALFGGGFGGFGGFGGAGILPWLLFGNGGFGGFGGGYGSPCATQADLAAGFNNSAVLSGINGIDSALCQGFNGINTAILQSTYNTQGAINGLSHQLSDCCCATQRAIDGVKYAIAEQSCDTRHTIYNSTRDIIDNANANSRAVLDFLVQSKLADKDARIAMLEGQVARADQNAVLRAAIDASTAEIIRRTGNDCPTAAYIVQPPQPVTFPTNCCGQAQFGGCNGGF